MIKKIIVTDDLEWSNEYIKEHNNDTIRYSSEEINNMMSSEKSESLQYNLEYHILKYVLQNEYNLVMHKPINLEEIENSIKSRNAYNKRIKKDIRFELEKY